MLFATGWDHHWRTDRYGAVDHPYLTAATAAALVDAGAALVGIDSVNADDTRGGERPTHSALLATGIPLVEHLTGNRFRFFAVPVKVTGLGTFPVRAFANRREDLRAGRVPIGGLLALPSIARSDAVEGWKLCRVRRSVAR